MSLNFGTSAVNTVTYNGNDVKQIIFNDSSAWAKPYTLSVSKGTGVASVTVSRTSTLEPTASTGSISAGDTIFYGDVLSVSATAATGYLLDNYATSYTVSDNNTEVSVSATPGYYTVSLDAITNATAYVNTSTSGYSGSITAQYGSTIYVQVKPNNCYVYTLSSTNYTPSSPYTTSYVLNSTNFNLSSTTPAASPTASNKPTATKSIGGSVGAAYYKVTLTVTNGTVVSGATTTIRYGSKISYTAKGNWGYYYGNKIGGGYGDGGVLMTYTPTSSVLPADGGATQLTAVEVSHTVGSCTAYKTYTIKTTATGSCVWGTYVRSIHALGQTSFVSTTTSGTSYTVYETDVFYSFGRATSADHKLTEYRCKNNNVTESYTELQFLTVGGSGNNTYWTTTTLFSKSTGIPYRADFGISNSPMAVEGNVDISYKGAALTYTYYPYKSNMYSNKINSGTTTFFVYDKNNVSTVPPRLDYYPASAIRINGCICLQNDSTNTEFADLPLTTTKTANLKYSGISGTAQMGNQGPRVGSYGTEQCQWLSVSKKAGLYKFYVRIWGLSIPS
jgi:hypothetical protein